MTLLPKPRRMRVGDERVVVKGVTPREAVDAGAVPHEQGYRLTVDGSGVRIEAHDQAGLRYARCTLKQITEQADAGGRVEAMEVEDWPDFAARGVMLDISRDRVPTMATLRELVDLLASWKINQFQLYTEHTFAYRDHRVVWEHASPMTAGEIRELDAYCRERGIELVPNQNSFGHLGRWLQHEGYAHLAESREELVPPWGGEPQKSGTLHPDEASEIFLAGLFDELLPHFSSKLFNVGCDETWELGLGRSKAACEARGVVRVYVEFLKRIHKLVTERGRTMMFWGDIVLKHPELIAELPKDVIALEWGYEANHPFDVDCKRFAAAGLRFYVCPGTSTWNTIAGRTDNAMGNLRSAAENGLKHGACGFLNTDWGDNGHWQPLPVSYWGYAYGAAVSWCAAANGEMDIATALDRWAFADRAGVMGAVARDLGNVYQVCGGKSDNRSAVWGIWLDLEKPTDHEAWKPFDVERLRATVRAIDRAIAPLDQAKMERTDAALIAAEYRWAAALLKHLARVGIARLEHPTTMADVPVKLREALAAELEPLIAEHQRLWRARSREGGLSDSAGRLRKVLGMYRE
ncbi:MAG: beta-N-acetylhexosaminidase [Phycisphaerales bacterium]